MGQRGSVLVHVLITSVLVAAIAAGLLRMVMARHALVTRADQSVANQKQTEKAFNRLLSIWNAVPDGVCSSATGLNVGYTCTGSPGVCNCTCVFTSNPSGEASVIAQTVGGRCEVSVTSTDP